MNNLYQQKQEPPQLFVPVSKKYYESNLQDLPVENQLQNFSMKRSEHGSPMGNAEETSSSPKLLTYKKSMRFSGVAAAAKAYRNIQSRVQLNLKRQEISNQNIQNENFGMSLNMNWLSPQIARSRGDITILSSGLQNDVSSRVALTHKQRYNRGSSKKRAAAQELPQLNNAPMTQRARTKQSLQSIEHLMPNPQELPSLSKINNRQEIENEIRHTGGRLAATCTLNTPRLADAQIEAPTRAINEDQYRYFLRHQSDVCRGGKSNGHMNTSFIGSFRAHLKLQTPEPVQIPTNLVKKVRSTSLKSNFQQYKQQILRQQILQNPRFQPISVHLSPQIDQQVIESALAHSRSPNFTGMARNSPETQMQTSFDESHQKMLNQELENAVHEQQAKIKENSYNATYKQKFTDSFKTRISIKSPGGTQNRLGQTHPHLKFEHQKVSPTSSIKRIQPQAKGLEENSEPAKITRIKEQLATHRSRETSKQNLGDISGHTSTTQLTKDLAQQINKSKFLSYQQQSTERNKSSSIKIKRRKQDAMPETTTIDTSQNEFRVTDQNCLSKKLNIEKANIDIIHMSGDVQYYKDANNTQYEGKSKGMAERDFSENAVMDTSYAGFYGTHQAQNTPRDMTLSDKQRPSLFKNSFGGWDLAQKTQATADQLTSLSGYFKGEPNTLSIHNTTPHKPKFLQKIQTAGVTVIESPKASITEENDGYQSINLADSVEF